MPFSSIKHSRFTIKAGFRSHSFIALLMSVLAVGTCSSVVAQTGETEASAKMPQVELDTSKGKIILELNPEKAPKTVANFLSYVKSGHYNGTIFHRVIPDFMIQGGGLDAQMKERDTKPPIVNEGGNGLKNDKYSIAMARTQVPDSATSQFFINTKDNDFLNSSSRSAGYTVFGRVVKGLGVVDAISKTKTTSRASGDVPGMQMRDVPVEPITIKSAKIL